MTVFIHITNDVNTDDMICHPTSLSSDMFGMKHDIKRIYLECLGKPAFRSRFERKLGTLIKTRAARGSIDYNKLISEIRCIEQICKQREFGARKFLEIITGFAQDACLGHHAVMTLDVDSLQLEAPIPPKYQNDVTTTDIKKLLM
ncbi:hypothetical protein G3570_07860 [Balneolaceae bacterium YR4-1]|uniref:Uncharacterized protein n=1 Tax=Halalkalibaculum roseum TaxID=2709311 RepID=A0A6M1T8E3_9BACT|nr:hypothetical protein [Halalkalibaculum roseum]NGP76543.1 hypothetical protein [Halalkalibaculum roseum]